MKYARVIAGSVKVGQRLSAFQLLTGFNRLELSHSLNFGLGATAALDDTKPTDAGRAKGTRLFSLDEALESNVHGTAGIHGIHRKWRPPRPECRKPLRVMQAESSSESVFR